jgi:hypothetical protein
MTARVKREYYHVKDGEWIEVPKRGFKEQCCDCGLVHRLNFRINAQGKIEIQAFRDGKATGGARKGFQFTKDEP